MLRLLTYLAIAFGLSACGSVQIRNPVPAELVKDVRPLGTDGLRTWGDGLTAEERETFVQRVTPAFKAWTAAAGPTGVIPTSELLALSGGGQWGAFGAGVLKAWSESGTRPEFAAVSGVSTGAIIAPFAFLGSEYDDTLTRIYSEYSTDNLLVTTIFSGLISGTALTDTTPFREMIAKYVTQELLEAIAAEHRQGRLLLVGTTNLDAGRPVIWNMGAIAASGHPGALQLFRDVIEASAAIPVAFPPQFIRVMAPDGSVYDEMHVDGGASSQVTLVTPQIPIAELTRAIIGRDIDRRLWVIMNNNLEPPHRSIRPRINRIAAASISSLIRGSGTGDIFRLYAVAERDAIDFNVTWVPSETGCAEPSEAFDPAFMACLHNAGMQEFKGGALWRKAPPFFTLPKTKLELRQGKTSARPVG